MSVCVCVCEGRRYFVYSYLFTVERDATRKDLIEEQRVVEISGRFLLIQVLYFMEDGGHRSPQSVCSCFRKKLLLGLEAIKRYDETGCCAVNMCSTSMLQH